MNSPRPKNQHIFQENKKILYKIISRAICVRVGVNTCQFLIATLDRYMPLIFTNGHPRCHRRSHPTMQNDDAASPRFILRNSSYRFSGHLIPNSDCTPSGYYKRGVHREDIASTSNPFGSGTNQLRSSRFEQISSWPPRIA